MPTWIKEVLDHFGLSNLDIIRERLSQLFSQFLQLLVSHAVVALGVMVYLMFFPLRDGTSLTRRIKDAVPLRPAQRDELFEKFTIVVRATVKGSVLVAIL